MPGLIHGPRTDEEVRRGHAAAFFVADACSRLQDAALRRLRSQARLEGAKIAQVARRTVPGRSSAWVHKELAKIPVAHDIKATHRLSRSPSHGRRGAARRPKQGHAVPKKTAGSHGTHRRPVGAVPPRQAQASRPARRVTPQPPVPETPPDASPVPETARRPPGTPLRRVEVVLPLRAQAVQPAGSSALAQPHAAPGAVSRVDADAHANEVARFALTVLRHGPDHPARWYAKDALRRYLDSSDEAEAFDVTRARGELADEVYGLGEANDDLRSLRPCAGKACRRLLSVSFR
jgi:hypothetical protein